MATDIAPITFLATQARNAGIWQDDGAVKLYLHCLIEADHSSYLWYRILVHSGEIPLLERHTASSLGWSRNKLDRKLQLLQDVGLIELCSLSHQRHLIKIVHWPHIEASEKAANSFWKTQLSQNGANGRTVGSMVEPNWPHDEAKEVSAGFNMEPVPNNNSKRDYSSYSTTLSSKSTEPAGFTDIWIAYPSHRRNRRSEAAHLVAKAFEDGATVASILDALNEDMQSETWLMENGRYIPGIVKWLEKETWRGFAERSTPEEDPEKWTSL